MIQVGHKVSATVRKVTAELTVTRVIEAAPVLNAAKPGLLCSIIAEGKVKRSDWCKLADVYENGEIVWW